ncbi:MFS transporter [Kangiella marina]|uniref:MFS transporter n=1 Tax=Kangiella marina TaxID=1079178 RepID=A0ABP8IGC1_9GAMM
MNYLSFVKSNKYLLLFGFLCVFVGNLGQTFFISLFNKDLIGNLLLEKDNLSLVYSVATLISGFTIFFVGAKIDDIDVKTFTTIVILGLIGSCILFANSSNLIMLFFSYLGIRLCGQGLMTHIAVTTLMRYIPQHRGKAVSLSLQGMAFGEMIMPAIAVGLLKNYGHTTSWHSYAIVALVLVFPLLLWLLKKADLVPVHEMSEKTEQASDAKDWSRSEVMSDWRFWLILPAIIGPAFLITGIFFHQTILIDGKGWTLDWLSIGLMLYGFIHFLGAILTGPLVDATHPRVYMRWYLLPLVLGMVCLYIGDHKAWLLAFMFLAGMTVASSGPVINSFYAEVFGNTHLGAIRALVSATMIISTGIAPYLFSLFDSVETFLTFAISYGVFAMVVIQKKLLAEKN